MSTAAPLRELVAEKQGSVRTRLPDWSAAVRTLVRGREIWLVTVATLLGCATAVVVSVMGLCVQWMHEAFFRLPPGQRLSSSLFLDPLPGLLMPAVGGLFLGVFSFFIVKVRRRPAVDPIEANALHGGRMSIIDSTIVVLQTIISNGFGASVGLEAGYTQAGAVGGSRIGLWLRLRRADVRVLVGCGAAAAIAAAFGAPVTGAFYAFELIIGTYAVSTVAPVMAAAIAASLVAKSLGVETIPIHLGPEVALAPSSYAVFALLGLVAGLAGILLMRGVTAVEAGFGRTRIPSWLRPALGGVFVGGFGFLTPQVLSSGHGALHNVFEAAVPVGAFLALFLLKALSSAVSLGSGFRGGLFFASLYLGALLGKSFAGVFMLLAPDHAPNSVITAVVGMSAFAVAIVGGPLTMTFLALETTGELFIAGVVLTAAMVSSITVRELFGYSFSTWRLHLRGETIRSAHDIGWIRSLTAGRMMRQDIRTVREDMPLAAFRNQFPIGSKQRVVAIDSADRYAGLIHVPDAYDSEEEGDTRKTRVSDLLHHRRDFLTPPMSVKDAIAAFEKTESEALVVVDNPADKRVLGILTEQHAMKRYAEELDKVRQGLSGTI